MSFLTTYYPKKITFERKGENVILRPPDYKDWKSWSSLKEKNKTIRIFLIIRIFPTDYSIIILDFY